MPNLAEPIRVPLHIDWTSVHTAAEALVSLANIAGVPFTVEFNGDDLIARPGMSPTDVVRDWYERKEARRAAERLVKRKADRTVFLSLWDLFMPRQFALEGASSRHVFTLIEPTLLRDDEKDTTGDLVWEVELSTSDGTVTTSTHPGGDFGKDLQVAVGLIVDRAVKAEPAEPAEPAEKSADGPPRTRHIWPNGRITSGLPCNNCATSYENCTLRLAAPRLDGACCAHCRSRDAHRERVEVEAR